MSWIKFKNEKPNYDFEVLVCDIHGHVTSSWYRSNVEGDSFEDWEGREIKNITHWMRLPFPPKQ